MFDVTALGELLIDFTPNGISEDGNILFERNPGGAPANVLTALAKLKKETAFLGKVGNDKFGRFLENVLKESHVNTSGLLFSDEIPTTLAFVHLDNEGDRSFSFYRKPGADLSLKSDELNKELIKDSRIFHFGSLSLTDEPVRSATFEALSFAKESGLLVSYDPNLRPLLWESLIDAKELILKGMAYADIVKVSEEELEFLTGSNNLEEGTKSLCKQYGVSLMFITRGRKGCFYRCGTYTGYKEGFQVETVDTTGAGDAFFGGILYKLLELGEDHSRLTNKELEDISEFGNALAALSTTRYGGIPSMPSLIEIDSLIEITKQKS